MMRIGWAHGLVAIVGALLLLSGASGAAEWTFKFDGIWNQQRGEAMSPGILTLDLEGTAISGRWLPLKGYRAGPIGVTGRRESPDRMDLVFALDRPLKVTAVRRLTGNVEAWAEPGQVAASNTVGGVWVTIGASEAGISLTAVLPNGPADKAGAVAGDALLAVDGTSTNGLSLPELMAKIRGPVGSTVALRLRHKGGGIVELKLVRALLPGADNEPVPGNEFFWRFRDGDLSEAALTFAEPECGYSQTALVLGLSPGTTPAQFADYLSANPDILQYGFYNSETDYAAKHVIRSAPDLLAQIKDGQFHDLVLRTPVGSEVPVAQRLRRSGLLDRVELLGDGCGGGERSSFVVDKSLIFDSSGFSVPKFIALLSNGMSDLFRPRNVQGASGFRIANQRTIKVDVPPYPVAVRTEAFVASEVTRGVPGYWDDFYVSFEPTDDMFNTDRQYTVVVTVERLRSSRRSLGSSLPPDESYFGDFDSFDAEDVVTNSIVNFFARRYVAVCLKSGKGAGREMTGCPSK